MRRDPHVRTRRGWWHRWARVPPLIALADELVARGHPRGAPLRGRAPRDRGDRNPCRGIPRRPAPRPWPAPEHAPCRPRRRRTCSGGAGRRDRTRGRPRVPSAAGGGRRGRRVRVAARGRRRPAPAGARGGARVGRPRRARQPDRGVPRRPSGGDAPGYGVAWRGGHGQPDPARDRRGAARPGRPAARRRRGRQPRRPHAQRRRTRALRLLAAPHRPGDPPRDRCTRLRLVRGAWRRCGPRATGSTSGSYGSRSTWTRCTGTPRWW